LGAMIELCAMRGEGSEFDCEVDVEDPDDSLAARMQREHMLELYSSDYPELKLAFEDWVHMHGQLERRVRRGDSGETLSVN
jgi:hypothetical protein